MKWFLAVACAVLSALSIAETAPSESHRLLKDVCFALVLPQEQATLSAEQVYLAEGWVTCSQEKLSRGYDQSHLWLRVDLSEQVSAPSSLYLSILVPWIQRFSEYQFANGELVTTKTHGIHKTFPERTFKTPNFVLPYRVEPTVNQQVLLEFHGVETTTIAGSLVNEEGLVSLISWNYFVVGGALLGIFALMIYNAFVGISLKDLNYLNYVLYSMTIILMLGAIYGYNYAFFWPDNIWLNAYVNAIASPLTSLALLHFSRAFLHLQEFAPRLDRIQFLLQPVALCVLLLSLFDGGRDFALQVSGVFGVVVPPLVMISAITVWVRGFSTARFFVIAWFLTMVAMMSMGFYIEGLFEFSYVMYYGLAIAILCEMMLLSLALADKVNHLSRERTKANLAALKSERELKQALHSSAKELERKVRARTDDLEQAKQRAESLARTDELSGLGNRRAFFEIGQQQLRDAQTFGRKLFVMLVDIDLFKSVNDTHGHSAGDEVIREVSSRLKDYAGDDVTVCRIGGEEYGFLISNRTQDVKAWAESVRQSIASGSVLASNQELNITISGGVSELRASDETLDDVMLRADRVLYQAKEDGRNKICFDF